MRRQERLRDSSRFTKKLIRGSESPLAEAGLCLSKWTGPEFGGREPPSQMGYLNVLIPGTWTKMSLHLSRFRFISVSIHTHRKCLRG